MPIYEYYCEDCNCQFETLFFPGDPVPTCPSCCKGNVKKLLSAGAVRPRGIPTGSGGFREPACKPAGG